MANVVDGYLFFSLSFSLSLSHTHTHPAPQHFQGGGSSCWLPNTWLCFTWAQKSALHTHTHTHTHTQSSYWLPKTWLCFIWAQKFAFEKGVLTGRV